MSVFPKYDPPNPNQTRTIKRLTLKILKAQNYLEQIDQETTSNLEIWNLVAAALNELKDVE